MSVEQFLSGKPVESCRRVSFESHVILESEPPMLVVRGEAPCANMEVSLQPLVYVRCPEYWGIEVVGCLPGGVCATATKPYQVSISLAGIIGSQGIEIIGSNRTEQVELPKGCRSLQADIALAS